MWCNEASPLIRGRNRSELSESYSTWWSNLCRTKRNVTPRARSSSQAGRDSRIFGRVSDTFLAGLPDCIIRLVSRSLAYCSSVGARGWVGGAGLGLAATPHTPPTPNSEAVKGGGVAGRATARAKDTSSKPHHRRFRRERAGPVEHTMGTEAGLRACPPPRQNPHPHPLLRPLAAPLTRPVARLLFPRKIDLTATETREITMNS